MRKLGAVSQELTLLDQVPAKGDLRDFPAGQRLFDVTGVVGEGAGQVERVANRFAGAGGRVWPGHKGGIAEEADSAERHLGDRKVQDGLYKGLTGVLDERDELGREQPTSLFTKALLPLVAHRSRR